MRQYVAIHEDKNLNNAWWENHGMKIGEVVFYNAIRDGSGRYDGYAIVLSKKIYFIKTVAEAEATLKRIQEKN